MSDLSGAHQIGEVFILTLLCSYVFKAEGELGVHTFSRGFVLRVIRQISDLSGIVTHVVEFFGAVFVEHVSPMFGAP